MRPSPSSSTSWIIALSPRCVCGAPKTSIIRFSSVRSRKPSRPSSNLVLTIAINNLKFIYCTVFHLKSSKISLLFLNFSVNKITKLRQEYFGTKVLKSCFLFDISKWFYFALNQLHYANCNYYKINFISNSLV